MKKYIGIVKVKSLEPAVEGSYRIITKFSNKKAHLLEWLEDFPGAQALVIENSETLQIFFADFQDIHPVTEVKKIKVIEVYEHFMKF